MLSHLVELQGKLSLMQAQLEAEQDRNQHLTKALSEMTDRYHTAAAQHVSSSNLAKNAKKEVERSNRIIDGVKVGLGAGGLALCVFGLLFSWLDLPWNEYTQYPVLMSGFIGGFALSLWLRKMK
jgi:hypothetical protein